MRFISLFSGIGGLDLGLERAGMKCVAQVEKNEFCQKILYKHWPNVPKWKDIKDVEGPELPEADAIVWGFPCQPHSTAGKRKASKDDRDLWPEFVRLVRAGKYRWVVAENVAGLLSSESGRFYGRVLRDLAASGYDIEWTSLPAAAFGAPHIRERVFIVAHAKSIGERGRVDEEREAPIDFDGVRQSFPDSASDGRKQSAQVLPGRKTFPAVFRKTIPNPDRQSLAVGVGVAGNDGEKLPSIERSDWWLVEPPVGRVANGVPGRVDRLSGLGGAVVPQVAEFIGRCVIAADQELYG